MGNKRKPLPLQSLHMEQISPTMSSIYLSYLELKEDAYFSSLSQSAIQSYIETAISFGQQVAKREPSFQNLKEMINHLLKQGICIRFPTENKQDRSVRAQYRTKPPTIEVFRHSIQQIQDFFTQKIAPIHEENLFLLHLYHEWFHHLEVKKVGRADLQQAQVEVKKWGPFTLKKPLQSLREISAHAFTQEKMKLSWSPLLLDFLIQHQRKGWTSTQTREYFEAVKQEFHALDDSVLTACTN